MACGGHFKGGSAMKAAWSILLGLAVLLTLVVGARADEEKTLKGTITCAKCGLKEADACHTVIQVKEGDKEVTYYFDKDSKDYKKNHKEICQEAKKGSVTGTISEKDGKKYIKTTKVEFD
jgi:Family of unknown function (DUF6370)